MKWVLRTGNRNETWRVEAKDYREALKTAWSKRPPKSVGMIVEMKSGNGVTSYIAGERALTVAGYRIEKP